MVEPPSGEHPELSKGRSGRSRRRAPAHLAHTITPWMVAFGAPGGRWARRNNTISIGSCTPYAEAARSVGIVSAAIRSSARSKAGSRLKLARSTASRRRMRRCRPRGKRPTQSLNASAERNSSSCRGSSSASDSPYIGIRPSTLRPYLPAGRSGRGRMSEDPAHGTRDRLRRGGRGSLGAGRARRPARRARLGRGAVPGRRGERLRRCACPRLVGGPRCRGPPTLWHESFARNLDDLVQARRPSPLRGRLSELNERGVAEARTVSLDTLVERFRAAHATVRASIMSPTIGLTPYRVGSRPYSASEHVEVVRDHIRSHARSLERASDASRRRT